MSKGLTREQWLEHRKNHIGASEVSAIIGADPHRGPLAIWEAKVTGYSMSDNAWLKYGRDVESAISNMFEDKSGRQVRDLGATAFQYHPDIPFLAATLDRETRESDDDKWSPLELKNIDPLGAKISAKEFEEEPILRYVVQNQIQMACTGATHGTIAALFPGYNLVWHDMERNDDFLAAVYPRLEKFWEMVQNKTPPPPDDLPGTLEVVKRLYKEEDGTTVMVDEELIPLVDEWERLQSLSTKSENKAKAIESRIRAELGSATFGNLGDGTMLTLRTTHRKGYTVEPTSFRTLRRIRVK